MRERWLLLFCLIFAYRLLNCLTIRTYFDPDEWWQGLEPAWKQAFGYGYLTWDWIAGLRNWLYPLPFYCGWKLLKHIGWTSDMALWLWPRLVQAMIMTSLDWGTFKLAIQIEPRRSGDWLPIWTVLVGLSNWFGWAYLGGRTLSNSAEAALTVWALYWWPRGAFKLRSFIPAILLIGFSVYLRPSSLMLWIYPLLSLKLQLRQIPAFLVTGLLAAALVIAVGFALDSTFYGHGVFSWLNFIQINFFSPVASHFGVEPWWYYLVQGIPAICLTGIPFAMLGSLQLYRISSWHAKWILSVLFLLSLLPHKELRFLMPIWPVLMISMAISLRSLTKLRSFCVTLFLVTNLAASLYFSLIHQSGVISVMSHLRREVDTGRVEKILFLMPCHSTPYYAGLQRMAAMQFLTCGIPLDEFGTPIMKSGWLDESDTFYTDPRKHAPRYLQDKPSHVVMFEALLPHIPPIHRDYELIVSLFNSHWHPDARRRGRVLVYRRRK